MHAPSLRKSSGTPLRLPRQLRHKPRARPPRVASVASVATPLRSNLEPVAPARADGLDPDAGAYLDRLRFHGPATYGAMASALNWGATRAWRAEARLRATGRVSIDKSGKAGALASE